MNPANQDGTFPVISNLKAAVTQIDITPDNVESGIDIVGHRRIVNKVRDPLRASVLLLDDGEIKSHCDPRPDLCLRTDATRYPFDHRK